MESKSAPQPREGLIKARQLRKMSQQQVADLLETTYVNISRWERGVTRPGPYFRKQLVKLFGKTEAELDLVDLPGEGGVEEILKLPQVDSPPPESASTAVSPAQSTAAIAPVLPASLTPAEPIYDTNIPAPAVPLVGRDEDLAKLKEHLCSGKNVALTAVNGLPGVGKTTLAITLAHDADIRAYFHDGILWAGLGPEPATASIFNHWASLLGISTSEIAESANREAWITALRRAIGSRRMLLVIDDAWKHEDALVFKVGGNNCSYLITTRYPSIAGRLGTGNALTLQELGEDESMQLLRLIAPTIIEREAARAQSLVQVVGGLPLALTLIGNYLRSLTYTKQQRRIEAALSRLSDVEERLHIGEPNPASQRHTSLSPDKPISLYTVISVTDEQLKEEQQRLAFYALAIFPPKPGNFSEEAALAVANCTTHTLDTLVDMGLIEGTGMNHYTLHQTVADYARLRLQEKQDIAPYQRLVAYFTAFVEQHRKDYEALEHESALIFLALDEAHRLHMTAELMRATYAFVPYLRSRGLYTQAERYLRRALETAQRLDDTYNITGALLYLGEIAQKQGHYELATSHLREGLQLARDLPDIESRKPERIAALLADLGWVTWKRGDYNLAETYLYEGLELAQNIGNPENLCDILETLGSVAASRGEYEKSKQYMEKALPLARDIGDSEQICTLLINLGVTEGEQGNYEKAEEYFTEGLELAKKIGHREWISALYCNLGEVADAQFHFTQAEDYFQEGLAFARKLEQIEWMSVLLINLGSTSRKKNRLEQSEKYLQEALFIARQLAIPQITCNALYENGNLYLSLQHFQLAEFAFREILVIAPQGEQEMIALAWYGLAQVAAAQGDLLEARKFGETGWSILANTGHRRAKEVGMWLDSIKS